jgi:hypothetical protein
MTVIGCPLSGERSCGVCYGRSTTMPTFEDVGTAGDEWPLRSSFSALA